MENTEYDWHDKTFLLVEDDDTNIQVLKAFLKKTNVNVVVAFNGEQAVKLVSDNPLIDMVLMDIRLPVMDGYKATRMIKNIRNDLPVIVQTAHVFPDEKKRAFEMGCDDFLPKPIFKKVLLDKINDYLGLSGSKI